MNIPFTPGGPQPSADPGLYGVLRGAMAQQGVAQPMPGPQMAPPPMPQAPMAPAAPAMPAAPQMQQPEVEVQLAGEVVNAAATGQLNLPKFLEAIVQIAQSAAQQQAPMAPGGPQFG